MRPSIRFLAPLVCSLAAALPAVADVEIRTIDRSFDVASDQEIVLDVPLGEVQVSAGEPGKVAIEVVVSCSSSSKRCRERAEEIYLDESARKRSLRLEIDGYSSKLTSRPQVEVRMRVPARQEVAIDMGVGQIQVEDLEGEVKIDVGVGEATIFAKREQIGSLSLTVGVGGADIHPRPRGQWSSGFLFFGNEVYWDDGEGTAHYAVDVGVGDATVRLED